MLSSYSPSVALLKTSLVSRACSRDPELALAYETGLAHTQRAPQGPKTIGQRYSPFIGNNRASISSPHRAKSVKRRRARGGDGRLPPELRGSFTEGERAVLSVIAEQHLKHGQCDLHVEKIAAIAGVSRTTCQNTLRKAKAGLNPCLAVQHRPRPGQKNLTNIVRIISRSWLRWLSYPTGLKQLSTTKTEVIENKPFLFAAERLLPSRRKDRSFHGCEIREGAPDRAEEKTLQKLRQYLNEGGTLQPPSLSPFSVEIASARQIEWAS
jgi:hypothetical protein